MTCRCLRSRLSRAASGVSPHGGDDRLRCADLRWIRSGFQLEPDRRARRIDHHVLVCSAVDRQLHDHAVRLRRPQRQRASRRVPNTGHRAPGATWTDPVTGAPATGTPLTSTGPRTVWRGLREFVTIWQDGVQLRACGGNPIPPAPGRRPRVRSIRGGQPWDQLPQRAVRPVVGGQP